MAFVIALVVILVLLLLSLVGYWRDTRRGIFAIAGTLIGALLVGFWGEPWGQMLAQRFGSGDPRTTTFVVSSALFLFCALVVGYGGGVLLSRAKGQPVLSTRLANALLGLLNAALIVGYVLRFATAQQPESRFTAIVQSTPLARVFHDGLPVLFLMIAGGVGALVLARAGMLVLDSRRAAATAPAAAGSAAPKEPGGGSFPAERTLNDRDILNKINQRTR